MPSNDNKRLWLVWPFTLALSTAVACSNGDDTPGPTVPDADGGTDAGVIETDASPDGDPAPEAGLCGNRRVDEGEQCDDGNQTSGDGCSDTCMREPSGPLDVCHGVDIPLTDIGSGLRTGGVSGSTTALHGFYAGTCGGSAGREAVYKVTSDVGGVLKATITSSTFDTVLYARYGCEDTATQAACSDGAPGGAESVRVGILPGKPVFLFVDGYGGESGDFTMEVLVAPSGCGDGLAQAPEQCDDGNKVAGDGCSPTCEFEESGSIGNCPGQGIALKGSGTAPRTIRIAGDSSTLPAASDVLTATGCTANAPNSVYQIRSDIDGALKARLVASYPSATLHARNECNAFTDAAGASSQLDCKETSLPGTPIELTVPVKANIPTWVVVDANSSSFKGPFDLEITVTPKSCGNGVRENGEACDDGNVVDGDGCSSTCTLEPPAASLKCGGSSIPLASADGLVYSGVATATTVGLGNSYNGTCGIGASQSEDAVYAIEVPVTGTLRATVDATFGAMLYVQGTCGTQSSQLACSAKFGGLTPESLSMPVTKDQKLFLVVDGRTASAAGTFTARVSVTAAACGNGVIDGGETCDDGNAIAGDGCSATCQLEAPPATGDTCAAPNVITLAEGTPGKWSAQVLSGNTNLTHKQGFSPNATCQSGGADAIFTVIAPVDGVITATVKAGYRGSIGARLEGTCPVSLAETIPLTCAATTANVPTSIKFPVKQNKLYYVIVDAAVSADRGAFQLDVSATGPTCGDGIISGTETCDDGNVVGGDGCSTQCALEPLAGVDTCPGYTLPLTAANGAYRGQVTLSTASRKATYAGTCGGSATDGVVVVAAPISGKMTASLGGTNYVATLYARRDCTNPLTEIDCKSDNASTVNPKDIVINNVTKGTPYYFFIDGSGAGVSTLDVKVTP